MESLTLSEMRSRYPDEWVLVGNPDLGGKPSVGSVIRSLVSGIVLFHHKDKREVALQGRDARKGYPHCTLIYTGEIPKGRRLWL